MVSKKLLTGGVVFHFTLKWLMPRDILECRQTPAGPQGLYGMGTVYPAPWGGFLMYSDIKFDEKPIDIPIYEDLLAGRQPGRIA